MDEHLIAHSLCCEECSLLLEGTDHLFAFENLPLHQPTPPIIEANLVRPASQSNLANVTSRSSRIPSIAAALVALVALGLWGRVWLGTFNSGSNVAMAKIVAEPSLVGANSPRNVAEIPSQVGPLVPSPLQIALTAQETRYLLPPETKFQQWGNQWLDFPANSQGLLVRGLEPLTTSWELALEVLRNSLPLNWTAPENEGYTIWLSPLPFAQPDTK
jgi:hypothetical protein